jgi:hypothetical protein
MDGEWHASRQLRSSTEYSGKGISSYSAYGHGIDEMLMRKTTMPPRNFCSTMWPYETALTLCMY